MSCRAEVRCPAAQDWRSLTGTAPPPASLDRCGESGKAEGAPGPEPRHAHGTWRCWAGEETDLTQVCGARGEKEVKALQLDRLRAAEIRKGHK